WVDSDPDSAASISLFYEVNGGAPVLIAENLSEDLDGEGDQYLWDTTGLPAGDYTLSAVIADEESSVTVTLCCVITVPEDQNEPEYLPGLYGRYYGYHPPVNGGIRMSNVTRARSLISNSVPDASFIATQLDYGPGLFDIAAFDLGRNNHIFEFLGQDAASFSGSLVDTQCVVLHMTGFINLPAGTYNLRVRADDGYSILIDGDVIAEYNGTQVPTTRIHPSFALAEGVMRTLEIVYWEDSEQYELQIEISSDGGNTYQYLNSYSMSHLAQDVPAPVVVEPETKTTLSGLKGKYFSYHSAENDNALITGISRAAAIADSNDPTAVDFVATHLAYGPGLNDLGMADHLQQFLGVDAASLRADPRETNNAVLKMIGKIHLEPGSYHLRVRADDGYRVTINGAIV